MEKILEELAVNFPGNEDLIQVYRDWYDTPALKELINELDRYEPDWNKEKELGSWAAEFILDILQEKEEKWEEMTTEERKKYFQDILDERYEDFRCSHQFARLTNITLRLQDGENPETILAETDEKIMFPKP
ncbi:hypothetical protein [Odoribacter sp. Z80]|uniref:hypothetical protein n=1 Tax=Odoribacter sp. Z80 TaxID=2304575 RepID=UPI00137A3553|nr:hypothetical protein [Odoribacter sp. Z80]NCE73074.1 hypothetical protein [Odoribacter sp. Z80]